MPTGKTERFSEIEATYFDAERNYSADMASTTNQDEAKAVESYWSNAHLAWIQAVNAGLAKQGANVEKAYADLKAANAAVRTARSNAQKLSELLGKLKKASDLALKLVALAA